QWRWPASTSSNSMKRAGSRRYGPTGTLQRFWPSCGSRISQLDASFWHPYPLRCLFSVPETYLLHTSFLVEMSGSLRRSVSHPGEANDLGTHVGRGNPPHRESDHGQFDGCIDCDRSCASHSRFQRPNEDARDQGVPSEGL